MSIDAMKQALEALYPISHNSTDDPRGQADKAITALRLAIEQAEKQEPVRYCEIHYLPEPCVQCEKEHEGYNTPPQRQPLTEEEILDLWRKATIKPCYTSELIQKFARAIEAAQCITEGGA